MMESLNNKRWKMNVIIRTAPVASVERQQKYEIFKLKYSNVESNPLLVLNECSNKLINGKSFKFDEVTVGKDIWWRGFLRVDGRNDQQLGELLRVGSNETVEYRVTQRHVDGFQPISSELQPNKFVIKDGEILFKSKKTGKNVLGWVMLLAYIMRDTDDNNNDGDGNGNGDEDNGNEGDVDEENGGDPTFSDDVINGYLRAYLAMSKGETYADEYRETRSIRGHEWIGMETNPSHLQFSSDLSHGTKICIMNHAALLGLYHVMIDREIHVSFKQLHHVHQPIPPTNPFPSTSNMSFPNSASFPECQLERNSIPWMVRHFDLRRLERDWYAFLSRYDSCRDSVTGFSRLLEEMVAKPVGKTVIVTSASQLDEMCRFIKEEQLFVYDFEAGRCGRKHKLSLFQALVVVENEQVPYIVDLLVPEVWLAFRHYVIPILEDHDVFICGHHSLALDKKLVYNNFGGCITNVMDTSKAERILEEKSDPERSGLYLLCQKYNARLEFGINSYDELQELKARLQDCNWGERPLSDEKKKYAAIDVLCIPMILKSQMERMSEKQQVEMFRESNNNLGLELDYEETDYPAHSIYYYLRVCGYGLRGNWDDVDEETYKTLQQWRRMKAEKNKIYRHEVCTLEFLCLVAYYLPKRSDMMRFTHCKVNDEILDELGQLTQYAWRFREERISWD